MFNLANGMQVVMIPDHRVPVVTHLVWYRAGAADDPGGHLWHRALPRTPDAQINEKDEIRRLQGARVVNAMWSIRNAVTQLK
jgi:hypothetical protein